ncbi:MAG TPA: hypothetical protein VH639_18040 [Bryobacteraceae bacterium]|jgi:hypothetical protein
MLSPKLAKGRPKSIPKLYIQEMQSLMIEKTQKNWRAAFYSVAAGAFMLAICGSTASAQNGSAYFYPGNLVVSRSVYDNNPNNVQVGMTLPPICTNSCVQAVVDGTYPFVWNNDAVDASFGVTSKIFLDQITPSGTPVSSLEVPNSSQKGVPPTKDQVVTSFSSKSEMALNLSTDGGSLTFMGYLAPIDAIDVSNSNTPSIFDLSNPVGGSFYRVVAQIDTKGKLRYTATNAYSGNNGRAAILNNSRGANVIYTAGNAGNGGNPQPDGIIIGAGAQILTPEVKSLVAQSPGIPTPVASFSITQLGDSLDKVGKDTNFRGLTIFDNVLYYTKGSGGNGVNTVYFVDPTGTVCTDSNGVGLPAAGAALPTSALAYDPNPNTIQSVGLDPNNMCILNGFPTALKSKTSFPFGIWFANATTLYVADEGNGTTGKTVATFYNPAALQTTAGLQKWILASGKWQLAYTLTDGLDLGTPYTVPGYPSGNNSGTGGTGFPWAPATDGLRNITGIVNDDGTATIYAITSTISGNGDQGADPNKLVAITDTLSAVGPSAPSGERFNTIKTAGFGEVLRGVSFTPGTSAGGR